MDFHDVIIGLQTNGGIKVYFEKKRTRPKVLDSTAVMIHWGDNFFLSPLLHFVSFLGSLNLLPFYKLNQEDVTELINYLLTI